MPQEITRLINERNEVEFARKATQSGGSLTVVRCSGVESPAAALRNPDTLARCRPGAPPPEAKGSKKQSLKTNLKSAVGARQ